MNLPTPWRKQQIEDIIDRMNHFYVDSSRTTFKDADKLDDFTEDDKLYFNSLFSLPHIIGGEPDAILNTVLSDASKYHFAIFMLRNGIFAFPVSYTKQGVTAFQLMARFVFLGNSTFHGHGLLFLFGRGYKIQQSDIEFVSKLFNVISSEDQLSHWCIIRFALLLNDPDLLEAALMHHMSLFTIVSFKMKKPVGIRYPNLLGVANNAFLHYRSHGDILLKAMKHYGVYEEVIKRDRKNTFQYRMEDFELYKPVQEAAFNDIVFKIFPELEVYR
ncbi:MAG: hypothetical protein EOP48_30810 [Sphingobacteriales bacterium]|nr:MAG: hypothetical protein EOP48_30810 [Sphingobacteriales bacterium]